MYKTSLLSITFVSVMLTSSCISSNIISKKYLIGSLPKDYNAISVNNKTKTLFAKKANSIFKIKLEK